MSNKKHKEQYLVEMEPFDAVMRTYYHVSALKNLINNADASKPMDQLSEYELACIFDMIMYQVLNIGRCLDAQEGSNDFFSMAYNDRVLPDFPGSLARAKPANID